MEVTLDGNKSGACRHAALTAGNDSCHDRTGHAAYRMDPHKRRLFGEVADALARRGLE